MSKHKELTGEGGTANKSKFDENFERIFRKPGQFIAGDLVSHKGRRWEVQSVFGGLVKIVDGDQFTLLASKASGVTAFKNGEAQATITSEPFRQALLKIWLGDEPAQNSLKEAMLGK